MTEQKKMEFNNELISKDEVLGKEITITAVGEATTGSLGSIYRVATVQYGGKEMQIALGLVLSKQYELWSTHVAEPLPCKAKIIKPRAKRYYSFEYITKA